jgi:uncharacterized coiled-coil DUF342 family protein
VPELPSYYGKPTQSQLEKVDGFKRELEQVNKTADDIFKEYRNVLQKNGIKKISREEWDKKGR